MTRTQDEVRRLHRKAREDRDERLASMSPIERMEEAYRLFRIVQEDAQEEGGGG